MDHVLVWESILCSLNAVVAAVFWLRICFGGRHCELLSVEDEELWDSLGNAISPLQMRESFIPRKPLLGLPWIRR